MEDLFYLLLLLHFPAAMQLDFVAFLPSYRHYSICGVEFQYHWFAFLNNSSSNMATFITEHSTMTTFIISARTGSLVMWVG
jgi:hypothetical protein